MSNKKIRVIDLESLDKAALDREKVILEIKNLTDAGQSPIEIFMKRRIIPVFLPFVVDANNELIGWLTDTQIIRYMNNQRI